MMLEESGTPAASSRDDRPISTWSGGRRAPEQRILEQHVEQHVDAVPVAVPAVQEDQIVGYSKAPLETATLELLFHKSHVNVSP